MPGLESFRNLTIRHTVGPNEIPAKVRYFAEKADNLGQENKTCADSS
jgi:hypothetical protein